MDVQFDIVSLLKGVIGKGISDIHIQINEPPAFRMNGKIIKSNLPIVTDEDFRNAITQIVPDFLQTKVYEEYDTDFSYEIPGLSRFRVNVGRELSRLFMVIRVIPFNIPNFKDLNLPVGIKKVAEFTEGLVLVTGATGNGKSSTLAAILNEINQTQQKHIVTIEDPIEYVFTPAKCIIKQRQIDIDTGSFPAGVKYSLRQDPDIILIGEIRDKITLESALAAAETGHLVFSTLHTYDAAQTISRIVNFYPAKERDGIRKQVSELLRATIAQKLVPSADKKGRCPACEIMFNTPTIQDYILKDDLYQVTEMMKQNTAEGMLTYNISLYRLQKLGLITKEVALQFSNNPNELAQYFRGVYKSGSQNIGID